MGNLKTAYTASAVMMASLLMVILSAHVAFALVHAESESHLPGINMSSRPEDTFNVGVCQNMKHSTSPSKVGCKNDQSQHHQETTSRVSTARKDTGILRVELKHRTAHPMHRSIPPKDSLSQSLRRDAARTHGISRRVANAGTKTGVSRSDHIVDDTDLDSTAAKTKKQPRDRRLNVVRRANDPLDEKVAGGYLGFEGTVESGASLGSGEYFMDMFLGSPPRHIPVIIDTGSDLTWVQCAPCKHCYSQTGAVFDPANSTSYGHVPCSSPECLLVDPFYNRSACGAAPGKPSSCSYFYWYGDFSNTTGDFATETFTLNVSKSLGGGGSDKTLKIERVMFGCGHSNEGLFHGAGGLLGLGQGEVSFSSQLGSIYGNKFSYCLVDRDNPLSVSSTIVFGDVQDEDEEEEEEEEDEVPRRRSSYFRGVQGFQFTPFVKNPVVETFYYVEVSHLIVGGVNLTGVPASVWKIDGRGGGGGTIVDSGTTLTYFAEPAYSALRGAFAARIGLPRTRPLQPLELCYNVTGVSSIASTMQQLPTFSVVFANGAVWHLPQKNVFIQPDPDEQTLCLGILGCPQNTVSIIGNYQQQNFHMVFDRAKSQLGFAPTDCSSF
jgi:hypothetical protein